MTWKVWAEYDRVDGGTVWLCLDEQPVEALAFSQMAWLKGFHYHHERKFLVMPDGQKPVCRPPPSSLRVTKGYE
jgi:hypothetical protein